ncbi:enoyl-(acyl carrier protein) reductase [Fragilaria crotonensis]|nr:enoyl-(acyl carrier protein) reductase [Fragilaria crotonensis]
MTAASTQAPSPSPSSLFSVVGKNVLVTGGSRGIGFMIAKGFVQAGANVLLTSRDETACAQAAAKLSCHYVTSNVGTREGCKDLASQVSRVFDGNLHVLVNNLLYSLYFQIEKQAGTSWGEPLERESGRLNWGFDKVFDLNVKGLFYLTRECIPMLEHSASKEDPSRIINIGSVTGLVPQNAPTHAYDISKAAVHQLTKKFAADLAPRHITVNAVAPGFVPSRMSQGLASWGGTEEAISKNIPLGRMGNDDDMAGACLYFSSRAGAWCTGVILNVDGGQVGAMQIQLSNL